jgi:hypothetical protein
MTFATGVALTDPLGIFMFFGSQAAARHGPRWLPTVLWVLSVLWALSVFRAAPLVS